jgi:hypothetical protein
MSTRRALQIIEEEVLPSTHRTHIIDFVRDAKRGLMKGFKTTSGPAKVLETA